MTVRETPSDWAGHFSSRVLGKARAALANPGTVVRDRVRSEVYWVRGGGGSPYRVQIGEGWASCGCPNGDMTGGAPRCYHLAAVLLSTGHVL